jgi:hypothetical protein
MIWSLKQIVNLQAEELIKKEMLVMMHYDAVKNPTPGQLGLKESTEKHKAKPGGLVNEAQYYTFLQRNPYDNFDENDIKSVRVK